MLEISTEIFCQFSGMCLLLDTQQKVRRRRRLSSSLMGLTGVGTFARRIFWLCWAPCCMSELSSVKSSQGACAENFQSLRLLLHNYGPQWPDSSLSCGLKKTHCPCPRVVHTSAASQLAVNVVLRCRDNNSRTKIVENFSQYLSSKSWGDWKKNYLEKYHPQYTFYVKDVVYCGYSLDRLPRTEHYLHAPSAYKK